MIKRLWQWMGGGDSFIALMWVVVAVLIAVLIYMIAKAVLNPVVPVPPITMKSCLQQGGSFTQQSNGITYCTWTGEKP